LLRTGLWFKYVFTRSLSVYKFSVLFPFSRWTVNVYPSLAFMQCFPPSFRHC
jgi:hypothetical protein